MSSSYAPLQNQIPYQLLGPIQQQQDVGALGQLTGHFQQAGGVFRQALVSISRSYLNLENSFSGIAKGLSRVEPFLILSPIEAERLLLVQGLERGWDGDAAEPVEAGSIEAALELLRALKTEHAAAQDARVLPIADGRIQLEWHDADRSLEFEFTRPGWVAIGLDRADQNTGTKYYTMEINQLEASKVSAAYDWFVRRDPKIAPWPSR
jgi:hypothetical protein